MSNFVGPRRSVISLANLLKNEPLLMVSDMPIQFVYGRRGTSGVHVMLKDGQYTACDIKLETVDVIKTGYMCPDCLLWIDGFLSAWNAQIKLIHYPSIQGECPHCGGDLTMISDGATQCRSCLCIWTQAQVLMAKMCGDPEPLWYEFARQLDMTAREIKGRKL